MTELEQTPVSRATVADVAADTDLSADALRAALGDLQSLASDSPGVASVDDLVYEWRTAFRDDPLVERTPDAYHLAVPARVWADFAERLDWSDAERDAVEAVHTAAFAPEHDDTAARPLVLGR
ncbi:hypothetical protein GCM10009037_01820 [Halarchaeum grantii]|uniref:DUF8048 domain-containing protein n=1 Tax=Halarchaeum grantii TaxID=1193105 RepID=A0A830F5P9_9EURY|nr:hypothetical protein [Halarchaeum grantii]GGL22102.1 hypothetical protein GCM10009037_01820 [Halarchaeum grantii]